MAARTVKKISIFSRICKVLGRGEGPLSSFRRVFYTLPLPSWERVGVRGRQWGPERRTRPGEGLDQNSGHGFLLSSASPSEAPPAVDNSADGNTVIAGVSRNPVLPMFTGPPISSWLVAERPIKPPLTLLRPVPRHRFGAPTPKSHRRHTVSAKRKTKADSRRLPRPRHILLRQGRGRLQARCRRRQALQRTLPVAESARKDLRRALSRGHRAARPKPTHRGMGRDRTLGLTGGCTTGVCGSARGSIITVTGLSRSMPDGFYGLFPLIEWRKPSALGAEDLQIFLLGLVYALLVPSPLAYGFQRGLAQSKTKVRSHDVRLPCPRQAGAFLSSGNCVIFLRSWPQQRYNRQNHDRIGSRPAGAIHNEPVPRLVQARCSPH